MIRRYLSERASWLLLLLGLQLLLVFVAYLDPGIDLLPTLYLVWLNASVCIAFICWRYFRETRFYKSLAAGEHLFDSRRLPEAASPFEAIVREAVLEQTESIRQESASNAHLLEQEKNDLLSWIHEVKTPLSAMHLMLGRITDETLRSQLQQEWLRIHLLLDQELHRKRLPFLKNDLYMEAVQLGAVLNKEIRDLRSWCIPKGIGFDLSLEAKETLTDAKWLGFILRQLLSNAIKYSGPGTDISIFSGELDGHVTLTVRDRGRGIDPKDLPRIFDKGFTSTLNRQDGGSATGMGLYLARQAAQSLLIVIQAESMPGEGSAFTLVFPRKNDLVRLAGM
ncbi:sensor histidine kinase [Paenibacillus sp. YN15]|uniref:sensor histidine kinase n=1 Tax=Paenibacillus sp. YN15 TaxID=1742774 RepID=UPI000DCCEA78|nr:sensor histidine kinase [Paenibacillus sp. YN15]RAU97935.1 sensor histidine kinase [Paenibacillus sp. YN15]